MLLRVTVMMLYMLIYTGIDALLWTGVWKRHFDELQ